MANIALLRGLGAGLSKAGQIGMDKQKQELDKKLEIERELRAQEREVAREQRAQIRLETTRDPKNDAIVFQDGVQMTQHRSVTGNVLDTVLANQQEIENYRHTKQERDSDLEDAVLNRKYKQAMIDQAEADRARKDSLLPLEQDVLRAREGAYNRQYTNSGGRSYSSGSSYSPPASSPSQGQMAKALKEELKELTDSYIEQEARDGSPVLTQEYIDQLAWDLSAYAAEQAWTPQELVSRYRSALMQRAKSRQKK